MTLSAIKSMFHPGDYWRCDRTKVWPGQKGKFRRVAKLANSDLLWDIGTPSHLFTTWPKASEIIEASDSRLVFRYTDLDETITFIRLTEAADIAEAAQSIEQYRKDDTMRRTLEQHEREQNQARLDAERRRARDDKFRQRQPVTAEELIDALRDHHIPVSPGTVGALRKKIHEVRETGWSYAARRRPRFSYESQPSVLYMKVHDHLLLQDLAEPVAEAASDADLDHLFATTGGANVTAQPLTGEGSTASALDLFAS